MEALRSGDLEIVGDGSAVARFLTLFPLPEPVPPAVEAQAAPPVGQAPWYIFDAFWLRTREPFLGNEDVPSL